MSYRALYKYTPTKSDEVSLEVNDIIFVVEKCEDGWYIDKKNKLLFFDSGIKEDKARITIM
ncbi:SH3 domain protein [Dictyocaulus viviparus]|uniref:SH3 domain protein n=1 Tax=Dictyocaulus viviparus TaxID=29172 RepID=A0A0D8XC54_DICVI|nr:SH3 domain protein [Dictyocaulus viviparus]KJH40061.1 SH3 domain protein [Dictyocaulus viviparus]